MERKTYFILGSLLFLLIFIIYKLKSSGEDTSITTSMNSPENINDFKRAINKLIKVIDKDRKSNKLLLNEIQKMNKLNKLHTGYLKDIQPKIFNKDIEKHRVYIDTHNIHGQLNRADYVYYFRTSDVSKTNQTAGYTEINNVIGFRLVKAIIPNIHYNINRQTNIVTLIIKETIEGVVSYHLIKIELKIGFYTTRTIIEAFDPSKGAKYYKKNWTTHNVPINASDFDNMNTPDESNITLVPTYNIQEKKFKFKFSNWDNNDNNKFKFLWFKETLNSAHDYLGFDKYIDNYIIDSDSPVVWKSNGLVESDRYPNMSIHYVDLIIDEIPYIACKKNALGKKLIERIGLMGSIGDLIEYIQPWDSNNENYFFPISLQKLSIQLYETTHNHSYDENRDHTLEFEITTIKNPKKFNLI